MSSKVFADRLAAALADVGVKVLVGLPGGGPNLDLIGAAEGHGIRFVLAHGETAAAIMASTHGLVDGRPAAVVVTRGPGAASLANGLAQATLDRHPIIALTDTVPATARSRVAHQRLDQLALLGPVTKRSVTAGPDMPVDQLGRLLSEAVAWPAGAVHLDVDITATGRSTPRTDPRSAPVLEPAVVDAAQGLLTRSRRPVVIVGAEAAAMATAAGQADRGNRGDGGHGADGGATPNPVADVLRRFGAPVLTTYQGIGVVPTEGPLNAGIFTNGALERPVLDQADLIITLGLDLVEPIPAPWTAEAPVLRLSSVEQLDDYLPAEVDVVAPWPDLLDILAGRDHDQGPMDSEIPTRHREAARSILDHQPGETQNGAGLGPVELVDALIADGPAGATVTVDAGAHFLAVLPRWPVAEPHRLLISNGLATMGYAVPAAIGAALARPGEPVVALTGDGGLSMVLAELETIARLDLPITVVVFNDSALSLIEIKQGPSSGGPNAVRYLPTDFAAIAMASGLDGITVGSLDELASVCRASDWSRPRLIDVRVDPTAYPRLLAATRG